MHESFLMLTIQLEKHNEGRENLVCFYNVTIQVVSAGFFPRPVFYFNTS